MLPTLTLIALLICFCVVPSFLPPHFLQLRSRRRLAIRTAFNMFQESTEWSQRRSENPGLFGGRILLETPDQIVVQFDYHRLSERPGRRAWFGVTDESASSLTADECKSLGIDIPTWL